MAIELHHLNTHGMMEQACDVLDGVVRLKERIAELEKENESLKYSVAALETDLAMATRWRNADKDFPEDDKPCLVYLEGGFYDVDTCEEDTKVWRYRTTVTHWMPLPKAPEVE